MVTFEKLLESYVELYHHILEDNVEEKDRSFDKLEKARKKFDPFNLHGKKEEVEKFTTEAWWNAGWAGGTTVTVGVLDKLWAYYQMEKESNGE